MVINFINLANLECSDSEKGEIYVVAHLREVKTNERLESLTKTLE